MQAQLAGGDDGFFIWTGTLDQLNQLQAQLADVDPAHISLTWEVSLECAVFLDVEAFKGEIWRATGILDTTCFQKAVNKYLYLPFSTDTPRHILSGFIMGELIRYAKRSSSQIAFVRMQTLFWERLRLRGYTRDFLLKAFAMAPTYSTVRARLMAPPPQPATAADRCFVLVLNYSRSLEKLNLSRVLHEYKYLLPQHLRERRTILAWRVPRKIAGLVGTFRYPRSTRDTDASRTSPPPAVGHAL